MNENILITLITFADEAKMVIDHMCVKQVPDLTKKDYHPDGCTALSDAIGFAIEASEKMFVETDITLLPPFKSSIFILTDGEENSSKRFNDIKEIGHIIQQHTIVDHWKFFLAGAESAEQVGKGYRIPKQRVC